MIFTKKAFLFLALLAGPSLAQEGFVGIWNTYQSEELTKSAETIYQYDSKVIGAGAEFSLFPRNPPDTPAGGFYDIDITPDTTDSSKGSITWTLKQNQGASHLVYNAGEFDRYYVEMPNKVATAVTASSGTINAKTAVPHYEARQVIDFFGSGLRFPPVLKSNIIVMEVTAGSDITKLEQVIKVDYTLNLGKKMEKHGDDNPIGKDIEIWNTFQSVNGTGVAETVYDYKKATVTKDSVKFLKFPKNPPGKPEGGFYDIEIISRTNTLDEGVIFMTLKDNSGASHIQFALGDYDRYYIAMNEKIESAYLKGAGSIVTSVIVPHYEKRTLIDAFQTGLKFPEVLMENVIIVEVIAGTDLTKLEQIVEVVYFTKKQRKEPSRLSDLLSGFFGLFGIDL